MNSLDSVGEGHNWNEWESRQEKEILCVVTSKYWSFVKIHS